MSLHRILLRKKLVSQSQLEKLTKASHGEEWKLGEILLQKNLVSQKQLDEALKEQYWRNNGFWVIID
jgi:hypothetical protein